MDPIAIVIAGSNDVPTMSRFAAAIAGFVTVVGNAACKRFRSV